MSELPADAIDMERFEILRRLGGAPFASELVGLFRLHATAQLTALDSAIAQGDRLGTARCAHALKSSAANVGARAATALARELETGAPTDTVETQGARARALRLAIETALPTLEGLAEEAPEKSAEA